MPMEVACEFKGRKGTLCPGSRHFLMLRFLSSTPVGRARLPLAQLAHETMRLRKEHPLLKVSLGHSRGDWDSSVFGQEAAGGSCVERPLLEG